MNGSSNARIVRIAIAGSIAVHLVIAAAVHAGPVLAQPVEKRTRAIIVVVSTPKPTPTPPPVKPQPPKPRRATHVVRPAVNLIRKTSKNNPDTHVVQGPPNVEPSGNPNPQDDFGTPGPATTQAPAIATPTPKPACSAPDIPAKTIDAISPQAPPDVQNTAATAKIKVDLDASGSVVGTSVYASTGSAQLDRAALDAARESRYAPEEKNCRNVGGSYLFTVDFQE